MRRLTTTALAAAMLAVVTACSSTTSGTPVSPSSTASATAKAYTFQDCVDLLDYDFEQGKPQDDSAEAECAHLTPEEYTKAVGEVLTKHKDEIINPTQTP